MSARNMAKRTAAGTLALAVCLGGGALAVAGAASADANFKFDRIAAGTDRFDTAIQASKTAFPTAGQAGGVVLVNGWRSVDGLTASSLAGAYQASILYSETDVVPQSTRDEISRLGTKNVWLVGGATVLSSKLEADLKSAGFTVNRVGGSDRFETAAKVSDATMAKTGKKPAHVFVASGVDANLSDSTVLAPLAYSTGSPILLSEPGDAPKYTTDQLDDVKGAEIHVVGGKSALTDAVVTEVGAKDRIAGDDRGATANYVSDFAKKVFGFSAANAALVGAKNSNVADSLAAAAFLGNAKTTIHYAGLDSTNQYFKDHAAELSGKGWVIGGKDVVTDAQVGAATAAAQTPVQVSMLKVSPSDNVQLVIPAVDDATDDRTYTVSGLNSDLTYRVTLVNATSIKTVDGQVKFLSSVDAASSTGYSVDPGTRTSDISVVNGSAQAANLQTVTAKPVNGVLTFTVDGDSTEKVVPVVYVNGAAGKSAAEGGTSERLETSAKSDSLWASAVETYGLGGQIDYIPQEQASGGFEYVDEDGANNASAAGTTDSDDFRADPTTSPISRVESGYLVANDKVLKFDKSDKFYINKDASGANVAAFKTTEAAEQVTYDEFVKQLSKGDQLLGTSYQREASLDSVFLINDIDPAAPSVAAGTPTTNSVTLTLTNVNDSAGKVTIYGVSPTGTPTTSSKVYATATKDGDADAVGYQVEITGLTASGTYSFAATQTVGAEESNLSAKVDVTAGAADTTPPVVSSVGANDVNNGTGSTDEVIVTFSEKVTAVDAAKATLKSGAFTYKVTAATATNTAGTTWKLKLDGTLADAITAEEATYFLNLSAGAAVDAAANKSVALVGDANTDGVLDTGEAGFKY